MLKKTYFLFAVCLFAGFLAGRVCLAQAVSEGDSGKVEILADQTLEWHRNEKLFIARGNASASHNGSIVYGDILSAFYSDAAGKNLDIKRLTAKGNVRIESRDGVAYGDRIDYDAENQSAVMTGERLLMRSDKQEVSASEKFEYDVVGGKLTAKGNAMVNSHGNSLSADTIAAVFEEKDGKRILKSASAAGNVVIKTEGEILYGDRGVYTAGNNTAEITGNVRIERGKSVIKGDRGTVDLSTNISRLYGGDAGDGELGRVHGVFFPESAK